MNAGFMVGHCALRRHVMGEDAVGGQPTPEQLQQMLDLFHEAMDAGAWGLSTTQSSTHSDGSGAPVASRHAKPAELLALSKAVAEHEAPSSKRSSPAASTSSPTRRSTSSST